MRWNWTQAGWPQFAYDDAQLKPLETRFLLSSGEVMGAVHHISDEERNLLRIELLSEEAVKTSEIEGEMLDRLSVQFSAAILRDIDSYRTVLESYSSPLLFFIEWRVTKEGNVEVLNETAIFYRYFDATAHATFLYKCVEQTVVHDIPEEVWFLQAFDAFSEGVQQIIDMPMAKLELIHKFLEQNDGRLSQRARAKEFAALTEDETTRIEALYEDAFKPAT